MSISKVILFACLALIPSLVPAATEDFPNAVRSVAANLLRKLRGGPNDDLVPIWSFTLQASA